MRHVNDLSGREAAQKAKNYLPFLQRGGRQAAVVEAVLSAHRVKLFVKKENVMLMFALGGVRAPGRTKEGQDEPYGPEALSFMRRLALQRDVELEVRVLLKKRGCGCVRQREEERHACFTHVQQDRLENCERERLVPERVVTHTH